MTVDFRYPVAKKKEKIYGFIVGSDNYTDVFTNLYNRLYPTIYQISGRTK